MPGGPWPLVAHASQFLSGLFQLRLGEAGLGQFSAARVIRVSKVDHVLFNLVTEVGGAAPPFAEGDGQKEEVGG